jgi:hypothetical protein
VRRLFVAILVLCAAAPAAAQNAEDAYHVVVLSVGGDAPEALAREVREAVAVALAADGLRVLPEADVALRVPPSRLRGCSSTACAWELGRELGVSMVAAVATWHTDGRADSITVSLVVGRDRAHAASADSGRRSIAATAAAAVRGAQDARARAMNVERSAASAPSERESAASEGADGERGAIEPTTGSAPAERAPVARDRGRSLEEWVLPGILGAVGLAFAAGAVYALMPEECELSGPSGACLRGSAPNVGLGVLLAVTGGLSVAGAIVWAIVGGMPAEMGRIDVVLGPEGGGLGWRGTF